MKTLNECATVLRNLCAPLAAHSCETVQVYCKGQNFEYQMHEISRERSHLIGYQCALKDLDTYGNRDYARRTRREEMLLQAEIEALALEAEEMMRSFAGGGR